MSNSEPLVYQFGRFRFEPKAYRLSDGDNVVSIGRKPLEILRVLIENAGEVVEKDAILRQVWPHQEVEESNLTQQVYHLRRVLGDDPKTQNYIQTVPGRGYIFTEDARKILPEAPKQIEESPRPSGDSEGAADPVETKIIKSLKRLWTVAALLVAGGLIVVVAILSWSARYRSLGRRLFDTGSAPPRVIPFVTLPGQESYPSFSPDGKYLAFTSEGETRDNQDIYVKQIDGGSLIRITTDPESDQNVTWSPDGRRLAFLRKPAKFSPYKVIVVPATGGSEEVVGQSWGGLDWSPDGTCLATSDYEGLGSPTGIYLIPVAGGGKKKLTTPPQNVYDTFPEFSPDGKQIAFVRWVSNTNSDIFVLNLANGTLKQATSDQKRIPDLHWSSDGDEIYFVSDREAGNRLWRIQSNGGKPTLVTSVPVDLESFSISRNDEMLAYTQALNDTVIEVIDLQGTGGDGKQSPPLCAINSSHGDDTPRFSPDGSAIAFTSDRSGWEEIWVAKSNCTEPIQLTHFNQIGVGSPRWSPDGRSIVFDRNTDIGPDIYTIDLGGNNLRRLTSDPGTNNMPSWSGDGRSIYYSSSRTNVKQVFRISVEGGDSIQLTRERGHEPIESPDGKLLYYNNADLLWQKDLQTGIEGPIPELAKIPIGRYWDVAGDAIFFISQVTGVNPIVMQFDLKTRELNSVLEIRGFLAKWVPGLSYDPKHKRLAVSYVSYRLGDITLLEKWR